jgi:hypothetical protein
MLYAYRNTKTNEVVVCSGFQELTQIKHRSLIEKKHVWWEMRFIPIRISPDLTVTSFPEPVTLLSCGHVVTVAKDGGESICRCIQDYPDSGDGFFSASDLPSVSQRLGVYR